jgi:iron(III) transport system ATP-binding protein
MLHFDSVAKKYTTTYVLEQISFEVQKGHLVAITGESGCGKTTLLRLIAGLEALSEGRIFINEQLVAEKNKGVAPQQRKVGMVFQDYALFPHLTVQKNIAYGLANKTNASLQVKELLDLLDLVGLTGLENRFPHQLSGGQQQRVALARAIAPKPQILLLDEPFSNLDEIRREYLREEICQIIKKTGITALLVTHDTRDALSSADKIALLKKGKLVVYDTPQNLYHQPKNEYAILFFGKSNLIKGTRNGDNLETALGNFATHSQTVSIRPEHISIQDAATATIKGKVLTDNFLGIYNEYVLAIEQENFATLHLLIRTNNLVKLQKGSNIGLEILYWVGV